MMTRQARSMYPRIMPPSATFRPYACNSLQATARMVVLALLVDGEADDSELAYLNAPACLSSLEIDRAAFSRVLHEFCEDMAKIPPSGLSYALQADELQAMLNEVRQPALQSRLKRIIRHLLQCDGRVSSQEALFWRKLIQAWPSAH